MMKAHIFVCQALQSSGGSPTKGVEMSTVAGGGGCIVVMMSPQVKIEKLSSVHRHVFSPVFFLCSHAS